jgi:23S rRNA pseudouridine1911/1915/1917 synthase
MNYFLQNKILYEDNHLIIINKSPSEIVQGDKTGDEPLVEKIKQYIKIKHNKPGNVFLGVAHRLDRPASGIVIFAKTGKALVRLNSIIKNREINKFYWAIVKNKPPAESGFLKHYLIKNEKINKSTAFHKEKTGTKAAELNYKLIDTSNNYYLLEIELITGRHHQIRAQLAKIGCPVKGDLKYGFPRSNKDASISLHARKVEFIHPVFIHPVSKEKISITASPPDDPLWSYFDKLKKNGY